MYKLISYKNAPPGVKGFVADSEEDLNNIKNCDMGSTCQVLSTSKVFIKNGIGEWVEWNPSNNSNIDSAVPIEISSKEEMNGLLDNGETNGVYKYTGETTETYTNGTLYILQE